MANELAKSLRQIKAKAVIDAMRHDKRLLEQISLHEGRELRPYKDTVGKLTIGVGRNLTDRGISNDECDYLLANDIRDHATDLAYAWPHLAELDLVRQRVLVDMAFNLGVPGLMKFKNTLAAIQAGEYQRASKMMLQSKWAKQVGKRAIRLSKMMATGEDYTE
jgi:lysozyme